MTHCLPEEISGIAMKKQRALWNKGGVFKTASCEDRTRLVVAWEKNKRSGGSKKPSR